MAVKIYVNENNSATFVCPKCQKTAVKDLTRYIERKKAPRLKAKCGCGHSYEVFLEKRKKFRKPVELTGSYTFTDVTIAQQAQIGSMTVTDLSYSGLRIKLQVPPLFRVGDMIFVEFRLDDANQSRIRKKVIVKNIQALSIGLAYADPQNHDSVLGFYLFS